MKIIEITELTPLQEKQLIEVWEESVKSTHFFLSEAKIQKIKAMVPQALNGVSHLIVAASEDVNFVAFMGIEKQKLEMLFIYPEEQGKGLGRKLLQYAMEKYAVNELTVNEENGLAKDFYEHMGFSVYKRTDHDEEGNPYPLLYMKRV